MSELIMPFWLGYERSYAWPGPDSRAHPSDYGPFDPAALSPTLGELVAQMRPQNNPRLEMVTLAFANVFPQSTISHSYMLKSNCEDDIKAGMKCLQDQGIKVLLSVVATPYPFRSWKNVYHPRKFAEFFKKEYVDVTQYNGQRIGWGFDGININNEDTFSNEPGDQYDFQPDWTMVEVIRELRSVLGPSGESRKAFITYNSHLFDRDQQVLRQTAAALDSLNLMAYYRSLDEYKALFDRYARVVGAQKIFLGIGCVNSAKQQTRFEDVAALCQYPPSGKKGVMLWNASQDIAGRENNNRARWDYTTQIMANLR